jgi:hypothetical protein
MIDIDSHAKSVLLKNVVKGDVVGDGIERRQKIKCFVTVP